MNSNNNLGYFDNINYENNLSLSELNLNTNVDKIFRCKLCKKIPLILSILQDKNNDYAILFNCKCFDQKNIELTNLLNFIIILQIFIAFIVINVMKKKIFYFLV